LDLASLTDLAAALPTSGPGWLVLAFALGLVHAFDADHVMALSLFATKGRGAAEGARAGLRWSAGHGAVVLLAGSLLLAAGRAIPASFSDVAERVVGLVMIGLGLYVFRELARRRAHLHFHAHDGLPPHAHWHGHASQPRPASPPPSASRGQDASHPHPVSHQHEHGALLVGALHGLAGSAPILAVLPVAQESAGLAAAYLVLFGVGVAVAMVGVSGLLGHVAGRLALRASGGGGAWLRGLGAGGSVTLGAWLVFGA